MNQPLLLSLDKITLSFGGKPLFEDLSLHISSRDRICLVGKNGAGKTTLLRLMVEDLELDAGKRTVAPGVSIGYLAQAVDYNPKHTIKEFVLSGLPKEKQGEHSEYLAEMVINPLEIDPDALMQRLSGGQLRRAALAQALVREPDILLLDEPTNHLDLQAIEWLEGYLKGYNGALICISHDRQFLANISQRVVWLDRGNIKICPYGYGRFEEWMDEQVQQEARELHNLQKKVEAEHSWTQGGISARRKRNMRRMRELGRLREKLKQDKAAYKQRSQKIEMDALEKFNASKIVAEFKHVHKQFKQDDKIIPILEDFSHVVLKGDRVGILGRNGSGKSTFIKMITGDVEQDKGNIFRSKTLSISYFDQNRSELNPDKTLWETLCPNGGQDVYVGGDKERKPVHVCGYLKRFLFDPKIAHHKVSTLSGGMQNRLLLAKILADPGNLLILDEPTNDLDMDTLDMLREMLADYPGTLIIVSHDRDFLDRTVTEVLAFEGDAEVDHVFGGYTDYIEKKRGESHKSKPKKNEVVEKSEPQQQKKKAAAPSVKPLTYGERIELDELPAKIDKMQKALNILEKKLADPALYEKSVDDFHEVMEKFSKVKNQLNESENRWVELEEKHLQSES